MEANSDAVLFIPAGQPIPYTHSLYSRVEIAAIDPATVSRWYSDPAIDMTTAADDAGSLRVFTPGPGITLAFLDGTSKWLQRDEAGLALNGGGKFSIAYPNPVYDQPYSLEEIAAQEERDAAINAEDFAYGW